jgi:predicted  nucleic acid-binding Zn-ribbon protein
MSSDNVDLRFLGERMQQMQSDLRQVRADQLRQESEQVRTQDRLSRVEDKVDRLEATVQTGFKSIDARFDQVFQTMATNMRILLEALKGKLGG